MRFSNTEMFPFISSSSGATEPLVGDRDAGWRDLRERENSISAEIQLKGGFMKSYFALQFKGIKSHWHSSKQIIACFFQRVNDMMQRIRSVKMKEQTTTRTTDACFFEGREFLIPMRADPRSNSELPGH